MVRHPFDRLVSAFRDKLERTHANREIQDDFYFKRYGKTIVSKYRQGAIQRFGQDFFRYKQNIGKWTSKLRDCFCSQENNFGTPFPVAYHQRPSAELPTFWEFVQFVIASAYKDDHWVPILSACHPCRLNYDYIIKFEELTSETEAFLDLKSMSSPEISAKLGKVVNRRGGQLHGFVYKVFVYKILA